MIWFNGFPFLDNKEEHVFNVPVSRAMTSGPLCLPANDFPVREAEHLLSDNKFQGFPIVEDRTSKIVVGYIGRTELHYALNKARRTQPISPNAKCVFSHETSSVTSRIHSPAPRTPGPYLDAPRTFDELENATGLKAIDFTPYVDHTPISVPPRLPLETVMELFKKMGPRVILVEQRGKLMGLVTIKDCLKYQFHVEAHENPKDDTALKESQDRLWTVMRRVARWINGRLGRFNYGAVRLDDERPRPGSASTDEASPAEARRWGYRGSQE